MNRTGSKTSPKQRRLGYVAGLLLGRGRKQPESSRQLHKREFKTSTQKLGVRFSDRLRNAFRIRWLKIK